LKEITHNVRGKNYKIEFKSPKNKRDLGECDNENKIILIRPSLKDRIRLEVTLHEVLHACCPDLNEDAIDETAMSLSKLLWRLGYRRDNDE